MRLVELYVSYRWSLDVKKDKVLVYTNAPDYVLSSICKDIKRDGILSCRKGVKGIIRVLQARGYTCDIVKDIPSFGFIEG